jgi:thioglycine synthase
VSSSLLPSLLNSLKGRKKWIDQYGNTTERINSAKDTLDRIIPICQKIDLTGTEDITYRDRLGIPNYCAILMPDPNRKYWVSGKGLTNLDAKASVLMEAIERYSSFARVAVGHTSDYANDTGLTQSSINDTVINDNRKPKLIRGTFSDVFKTYNHMKVLHPSEVVEKVIPEYNDNMMIEFLVGFDLLGSTIEEQQVLVPASLVLNNYLSNHPPDVVNPFVYQHSNGLASGNVIEEAICHALCEVIERDAASIAELCSSAIPYTILQRIKNSSMHNGYPLGSIFLEETFIDDSYLYQDIDISDIVDQCEPVRQLVKRFVNCGIDLRIKDITQKDISIPTFMASSTELTGSPEQGHFVYGYGTHPDARIALIRAITEVSQQRVFTTQVLIEDNNSLKKDMSRGIMETYKHKWQFMASSSPFLSEKKKKNVKKLSEIKTYVNEDILDDIKLILSRLKQSGLKRAIVIDLTNPSIGIPVVRVIVPGLETFALSSSIMGKRAKEHFKERQERI